MAAIRAEDVSASIVEIYGTVVDQSTWSNALDGVRRLLGGAGAVAFTVDHQSKAITWWNSIGMETDGSEYGQRLHRINPRAQLTMKEPPGTLCWDYRVIAENEMDGHEFYDGINRPGQVRYFIGACGLEYDGISLFTSVERTKRQGHVSEEDISLYGQVVPHIANAYRLAGEVAVLKTEAGLFHLLDQSRGEGVVLLDSSARIVQTNAEAERVIASNDGLTVAGGVLKAWKAADNRTLCQLISMALETASGGGFSGGGKLSLPRQSGALPYLLRIIPWPIAPTTHGPRPQVAILLRDPEQNAGARASSLMAYFGLTRREADLADLLACGDSLQSASEAICISHNTARVHLHRIFAKTGVSSQKDLLRLILSAP